MAKNEEEYFLLDDLGSPLRQLTNSGQPLEEYAYDEFGQSLFNTPTNQPFGFTGYQQDEVSGLNYAQARYYDQNQGRFLSEDGIKGVLTSPMTLNPYTYVWNSPLDLVDKDGYFSSLGDIGKGISDFWNNNIHGTSNTREETLPDGTKHVNSGSSGGGIIVETSKTSIDPVTKKTTVTAGVQINIPINISIPTPWGKVG